MGLPVLPNRSGVLFPSQSIPVKVRRRLSRNAVEHAKKNDGQLIVLGQRTTQVPVDAGSFYNVGTLARIKNNKNRQMILDGVERVRITDLQERDGCFFAIFEPCPDEVDTDEEGARYIVEQIKSLGQTILELIPVDTAAFQEQIEKIEDPIKLIHLVAENLDGTSHQEKQHILETLSLKEKALALLQRMHAAKESLELQAEIRNRLSEKMTKAQRETILREHMKAIQDELGEGDHQDKLREQIENTPMPAEAKSQAIEELNRMEAMGRISPEAHMIRNYLDLVVRLPWEKPELGDVDLNKARKILDDEHSGLELVKKRIIEHLATLKLKKGKAGTILLFIGPPGVGKTSLGKSIASSLDRPFIRVSLGGVRDDAEVRGHRRTYIGAMPGKIIQGMKKVGRRDPVFLLDEIDKLGRGFSGDPGSALLEVLDPEQNDKFVDHYLDLPFDLSDVLFICTANNLDDLPSPLRDRLEIIEISSYTMEEKRHIALQHLVPKQLKEHGLDQKVLNITPEAVDSLINFYTREAGVRDLDRKVASLCRNGAMRHVDGEEHIQIRGTDVFTILGKKQFDPTNSADVLPSGVATGLAWTPVGGDILFIEARAMPGTGKLALTGHLGEVMKESAQIALSLIRSKLPALVPEFNKLDVHIHVPSGGIPKDGPSAGIALFSALCSLFTQCSLSPKTAMTGEVTLRGVVMPVGGIKEKLLAAHRSGIENVILCKRNEKDLDKVPQEILDQLKIHFIEDITELLTLTFGDELPFQGSSLSDQPAEDLYLQN